MNTYDYSILNDKEFEELCRDLISKELNLSFQSFKTGKDGGIDLRYSSRKDDNAVIIQAKQYGKSGYNALKSDLKNKELPKVKSFSPTRYIIATSVELSPHQVVEIKEIFNGYILTLQDIYHKNILDRILSENERIERKFYKLWLSSSSVLSNILHNGSYGMSKLLEIDIKNNMKKYVESVSHSTAYEKLLKEKIIIITGKPGIGKTTLARILTYKLMSEKECQLIEINDSINAATEIIDFNGETNQVIYFDDFLGANLYEIINPRNSEGLIHRFIQRVKAIPGKYLVITSRTTIINKALSRFEILNTSQYNEKNRFVIEIEDYSREEKAKILYNHIVFSTDNPKLKEYVKHESFFLKIIDHKNYSPRLIEFISGPQYSDIKDSDEYQKQVLFNLNNPETIWKASYENNLDPYERWILQSLITIKNEGKFEVVEKLFNERLLFESRSGIAVSSETTFQKSIKNLSGSYLNLNRNVVIGSTILSFSNPSIVDFLRDYISNDFSILKRMILSSLSTGQLNNIYEIFKDSYLRNYKYFKIELENFFKDNERLLCKEYSYEGIIDLAFTYNQYFPVEENEEILSQLLTEEVLVAEGSIEFSRFLSVITDVAEISNVRKLIKKRWTDLILKLYDLAEDEYDYSYIVELFPEYEENFDEWISTTGNAEHVNEIIKQFLSQVVSDQLLDDIHSYDFDEVPTQGFSQQYGYFDEYSYELKSDIPSTAESLLDDLLKTMGLKHFLFIRDLSIDIEDIQETITVQYRESRESEPYERDSHYGGSGYSNSSNKDEYIIDLFE